MAEELPSERSVDYRFTDLMKSAIAKKSASSHANFNDQNSSDRLTHIGSPNPADFTGQYLCDPRNLHTNTHTGASNHAKFIDQSMSVPTGQYFCDPLNFHTNTHTGASNHAKFIDQSMSVPTGQYFCDPLNFHTHTHTGASNHAKFIDKNLPVPFNVHTHTGAPNHTNLTAQYLCDPHNIHAHTGASNHANLIDQNLTVPFNINTHTGASIFDPSMEVSLNSWLASNHCINVLNNMQTDFSSLMGGNGTEGGIQMNNMSMPESTNGISPASIESWPERMRQEAAMQNQILAYHGRPHMQNQMSALYQSNEPQLSLGSHNVYSHAAASSGMQEMLQMIRNGNPGNQTMRKGRWSKEEDGKLCQLVSLFGLRNWSEIAKGIPGREGKQCRDRWMNHLAPNIKKGKWSEQEDKILIDTHKNIGSKWCQIAKKIPGRTENTVKNHWNATKRRKYPDGKISKQKKPSTPLIEYIKTLPEPSKQEEHAKMTNFKDLQYDTNQTFTNFEMPRNENCDVDQYDFLSHVPNNQTKNCPTEQAATMETSGLQDLHVFSNQTILNTDMPAYDTHGLQNMTNGTDFKDFPYDTNQTFLDFGMPSNESLDVDDYDFFSHVYTNLSQNCPTEQAATMKTSGEDSKTTANLQDLQVFSNHTILNTEMPADDIPGLQNMTNGTELDEFMYKENLFSPEREPNPQESTIEVGGQNPTTPNDRF